MKKHLDEIKRLQKIAGILKESVNEADDDSYDDEDWDEDEDWGDGAPLDKPEFISIIKTYYEDWMGEKGKKPAKNKYAVVLAHDTSFFEQDPEDVINHINDVFSATVEACGGTVKLKNKSGMNLTYEISGPSFEGLKSAWEYVRSEGFYEQYSDQSDSLNSANGNAAQWILTKLKTDPGMSQAVALSGILGQNVNENK